MSDIEAALKKIEADYNGDFEMQAQQDVLYALIDCARALAWRVKQGNFTALVAHHPACDVETVDMRDVPYAECTCGADAIKRLSKLT